MKKLDFYPKDYISISALNTFENCPFTFYLKYFKGIKPPTKKRITFGTDFQELLNAKYNGTDLKEPLDKIDEDRREQAEILFRRSKDFENIVSVDEPMMVDIGLGLPIMFVPDLLTEDFIVENKTTTGYYNKKSVQHQKQMTLYYLGVKTKYGKAPKCYYQIFNTKTNWVNFVETPKTNKDVEELVDWMLEKLHKMERCYKTGKWETGFHRFCDFPTVCPLGYIDNIEIY